MSVGGALPGKRCWLRGGQILQPFRRFLRSARAYVDREVGTGTDLVEEIHKLVGSECIRLDNSSPVRIESYFPMRPNAFTPMVFVREAAAGPANVRNFERL